jgi:hypothetical protein
MLLLLVATVILPESTRLCGAATVPPRPLVLRRGRRVTLSRSASLSDESTLSMSLAVTESPTGIPTASVTVEATLSNTTSETSTVPISDSTTLSNTITDDVTLTPRLTHTDSESATASIPITESESLTASFTPPVKANSPYPLLMRVDDAVRGTAVVLSILGAGLSLTTLSKPGVASRLNTMAFCGTRTFNRNRHSRLELPPLCFQYRNMNSQRYKCYPNGSFVGPEPFSARVYLAPATFDEWKLRYQDVGEDLESRPWPDAWNFLAVGHAFGFPNETVAQAAGTGSTSAAMECIVGTVFAIAGVLYLRSMPPEGQHEDERPPPGYDDEDQGENGSPHKGEGTNPRPASPPSGAELDPAAAYVAAVRARRLAMLQFALEPITMPHVLGSACGVAMCLYAAGAVETAAVLVVGTSKPGPLGLAGVMIIVAVLVPLALTILLSRKFYLGQAPDVTTLGIAGAQKARTTHLADFLVALWHSGRNPAIMPSRLFVIEEAVFALIVGAICGVGVIEDRDCEAWPSMVFAVLVLHATYVGVFRVEKTIRQTLYALALLGLLLMQAAAVIAVHHGTGSTDFVLVVSVTVDSTVIGLSLLTGYHRYLAFRAEFDASHPPPIPPGANVDTAEFGAVEMTMEGLVFRDRGADGRRGATTQRQESAQADNGGDHDEAEDEAASSDIEAQLRRALRPLVQPHAARLQPGDRAAPPLPGTVVLNPLDSNTRVNAWQDELL